MLKIPTYNLLRPVAQGFWNIVGITGEGLKGKNKGKWGYSYVRKMEAKPIEHNVVDYRVRDGFINQEQKDWGVLRGKDKGQVHLGIQGKPVFWSNMWQSYADIGWLYQELTKIKAGNHN